MTLSLEDLLNQLPEYAKDIKLNIKSVLSEEGSPALSQTQIYGIALAAVYVTQNKTLLATFAAELQNKIGANEIKAAKAAASIMAMNNVYYHFLHLADDAELQGKSIGLRMNIIANPGVPRLDFSLYSLAVSILNACGFCVKAHAKHIREEASATGQAGMMIHATARIAAAINSLSQVIAIEQQP